MIDLTCSIGHWYFVYTNYEQTIQMLCHV